MMNTGAPAAPAENQPGLIFSPDIAAFETTHEADVFAIEHGWIIADAKGPNHRCPNCPLYTVEKRGGYINRNHLRLFP
jgi:hypothetical protein